MAIRVSSTVRIPAGGDKTIDEYVGRLATGTKSLSVAHMIAPPGWDEPFQQPTFDEATIVIRGGLRVETDGGVFDVVAGDVILVESGERVRYSNPFREECEYYAVCTPAFSLEAAHREG
ncbi:MAG: cupin domain-containing protein [Bacteroidota bacterium]